MPFLRIRKAGLLTTVQDRGRWGYQARGVPVAGPMDTYAHRLANLLVGNDAGAATLEVTLMGPEIEFEARTTFAVTGAEFVLTLNGIAVPMNTTMNADAGSCLSFGERRRGARSYLAVTGGFLVLPIFGSRATHLVSRMGGVDGRPLRTGDPLEIGTRSDSLNRSGMHRSPAIALPDGGARLRVMLGPHRERFSDRSVAALPAARYRISVRSDRMGYRLEGPPLETVESEELISDAMPAGGLQVPSSGQPILLMADHATTGGYPVIATVITADQPLAGQLAPGDWIEFAPCTFDEARTALGQQEQAVNEAASQTDE